MHSSLEDVEFLARSASRIEVLDALHDAPRTRDQLKETTDASRTTLSRMLADFEDREWIVRENGRYRPTPEGEFVASEVTRLLENMEAAEALDGTLDWLPTDEFDFDLRRLRDSEVVTLRWNDPASMRLVADRVVGASRLRSIATAVGREVVDVLHEVTVDRGADYEGILTADAVDTVREHPELREQVREIIGAERTELYRIDGTPRLAMVMIFDEEAALCNHGSGGPHMEAVVTDDEAFRSWAERYFESAKADAEPIDADAFVT